MKNVLKKYAEKYAWSFKFWKFFLSKSLKELNVSVSAFPGVFRRQLGLQKIDRNFYNVVLGTNFTFWYVC